MHPTEVKVSKEQCRVKAQQRANELKRPQHMWEYRLKQGGTSWCFLSAPPEHCDYETIHPEQ